MRVQAVLIKPQFLLNGKEPFMDNVARLVGLITVPRLYV